MEGNYGVLILVKKRLDFILSAILLFILLSPQVLWDKKIGKFRFDHLFFAVIALLFVLMCFINWAEGKRNLPKWFRENIWLTLYAVALFFSVAVSTNPKLSLILLPRCLSGLFIVGIISMSAFTYEKIRRIFGSAAIGMIITAAYAIIQSVQGIAPNKSFTNLTVNPNMPGRVYAFFDNPNVYGFALVSLLPVTAAYALGSKSRWRITLGTVAFMLGFLALIMTYSRGPWFGFAVGMFIFTALWKPKLIPFILVLGAITFPVIPVSIKERVLTIFNPNDTSISYRGLLTGAALKLIADRPILGAGLGLDTVKAFVLENYWPPELAYRFPHAHNLPVQIWCEMGVFGVVTFFGAVIHNAICAVRSIRKKSKFIRIFISSLISGITGELFCGVADYPLSFSRIMMLFWILFGLLNYARTIDKDILCNGTEDLEQSRGSLGT